MNEFMITNKSWCDILELNGFDDWYLPSLDELNKLYLSKDLIGGFTDGDYWSSSEYTNNYVWIWYFEPYGYGQEDIGNKNNFSYVRAIRSF
jgi:hypothetical protein